MASVEQNNSKENKDVPLVDMRTNNSFWSGMLSWFFGPTNIDETTVGDKSHAIVSRGLIWVILVFTGGLVVVGGWQSFALISHFLDVSKGAPILIKTPFIFMALIFVAFLIFVDSLIKTLKYKSKAPENIIVLILKNVGMLILIWFLVSSKVGM